MAMLTPRRYPPVHRRIIYLLFAALIVGFAPTRGNAQGGGLPLQTFDAGTRPAGWTVVNTPPGGPPWTFETDGAANTTGGSGGFALADSDRAGEVAMDTELRTPVLDLSGATGVRLLFKSSFTTDGNAVADVDVSADGGATWSNVWQQRANVGGSNVTVDLTARAAKRTNVVVRFRHYNAFYSYTWQIDDVQIESVALPAAPGGLQAVAAPNQNQITLNWTDTSTSESGFKVERSPDGTNFTQIGTVAANVVTFTDPKLPCATSFTYRVRASSPAGDSAYSNAVNVTTAACPTITSLTESFNASTKPEGWEIVSQPGSEGWRFDNPFTARAGICGVGADKKYAIIEPNHGARDTELRTPQLNFTGYSGVTLQFLSGVYNFDSAPNAAIEVDVSTNGGVTWTNVYRVSPIPKCTPPSIMLDLSKQLGNQGNVKVRWHYVDSKNATAWVVDEVKIAGLTPPAVPTNLTATTGRRSAVHLAWTGDGAPRYLIERSADGGTTWTKVGENTNGATSFVDDLVEGNIDYVYRVRAANAGGLSGYSATAATRTGDRNFRFFDLTVSFYDTPEKTRELKPQIETIFRYLADAIFEMSNGAHKLRRVTIYPNSTFADQSIVLWRVVPGSNGSLATLRGAGGPGGHVWYNLSSPLTADASQFALELNNGYLLGHELGHYLYGISDEYGTDAVKVSIMSDAHLGWNHAVGAYTDFNYLNFSTPLNNTPGNSNNQTYKASAWEVLARPPSQDPPNLHPPRPYYPELAPLAPAAGQRPSIELPASREAARSALTFVYPGVPALSTQAATSAIDPATQVVRQLVLDRSSIMGPAQLDIAKAALKLLVDQTPLGDTLGLISFDGNVAVAHPLTTIVDENSRAAFRAAIDGITPGNDAAAVGPALERALNDLKAPGVPFAANHAVYLISASQGTTGVHPFALAGAYQEQFVELYSVGFGTDEADSATLAQLAEETDGLAYDVDGASTTALDELLDALADADHESSPDVDVTLATGFADVEPAVEAEVPIEVDATIGELDLVVVYAGNPLSTTVSLRGPSGTTTEAPCTDAEVGDDFEAATTCYLAVAAPPAGRWNVLVTNDGDEPIDFYYRVDGVVKEGALTYVAEIDAVSDTTVAYPQPIIVQAYVEKDLPIARAGVHGKIEAPDGSISDLTLRDDGVAPDERADDGYYTAIVDPSMSGEYYFTVSFDNEEGKAVFTEVGLSDGDGQSRSVGDKFERVAALEVQVTDVAPDDHADDDRDATALTPDNNRTAGSIDGAGDVDTFTVTLPTSFTGPLAVRLDSLELGMRPRLRVRTADGKLVQEAALPVSDGNAYLLQALPVSGGQELVIEVSHVDPAATTGAYKISIGSPLPSERGQPRQIARSRVYLPIVVR